MFRTSGYFKDLDCPFLSSGLCERPHCHFAHHSEVRRVNFFATQPCVTPFSLQCVEGYDSLEDVTKEKPSYSPAVSVNSFNIINTEYDNETTTKEHEENHEESIYVVVEEEQVESRPQVVMKDQSVSTDCPLNDNECYKDEKYKESNKLQISTKRIISAEELKRSLFDSSSDDQTNEDRMSKVCDIKYKSEDRKNVLQYSSSDEAIYEDTKDKSELKSLKRKKLQDISSDEEIHREKFINIKSMKKDVLQYKSNSDAMFGDTSNIRRTKDKLEHKSLKKKKKIQYTSSDDETYEEKFINIRKKTNVSDHKSIKKKVSKYSSSSDEIVRKKSNISDKKEKERSKWKIKVREEEAFNKDMTLSNAKKIDHQKDSIEVRSKSSKEDKQVKNESGKYEKTSQEKEYEEMEDALFSGRMRGRKLATVDILRIRMILADRDKAKKQS